MLGQNLRIIDTSIKIATKLNVYAEKSHRHFAFLFLRNKLLSIGQNNMATTSGVAHKFGKRFGGKPPEFPFLHAEIDAIAKLWGETYVSKRMRLVSLRLDKHGEILVSKPCKNCSLVLDVLGPAVIYFDGKKFCET